MRNIATAFYLKLSYIANKIQIFIEFTRESSILEVTYKYYRDFVSREEHLKHKYDKAFRL